MFQEESSAKYLFSFQFSVFSGQWSVVSGQWSVVSGQWSVVSGQWAIAEPRDRSSGGRGSCRAEEPYFRMLSLSPTRGNQWS